MSMPLLEIDIGSQQRYEKSGVFYIVNTFYIMATVSGFYFGGVIVPDRTLYSSDGAWN